MIERLERLVNLIIALRETRRPLTAAEIRDRVAGYGPRHGQDSEAFRRMFERDKADLRALGVPIDAAPIDAVADDRVGYLIDPRRYDLPAVPFTPAELSVLAVAVEAAGLWDEVGWSLRKLAVDVGEPEMVVQAPRTGFELAVSGPHRTLLLEAQLTRTAVRFRYRRPGEPAEPRTVEPHALVHRRGRWYLVGRDRGRDARRAFRLDRIEGGIRTVGPPEAFEPSEEEVGAGDVVPPLPVDAPATAEVLATEEVAWEVARRARGGGRRERERDGDLVRFEVAVGDPDAFVGWALELGSDLEVLAPGDLRDRVHRALVGLAGGDAT